mmetsp:Transcript_15234/g.21226  ORF Transcript_15234/g.21226 Transcript_15234/m.21226 type:complete len:522 (-) Transcript_15234:512-2077(-)
MANAASIYTQFSEFSVRSVNAAVASESAASASSSSAAGAATAMHSIPPSGAPTRPYNDSHHQRNQLTYISRLIVGLQENLQKLGASTTKSNLEKWAIFIHESMSISSRNYHSVQHVFDISKDSKDPLLIISAYFHDVIYYHVDGCLSPIQEQYLKGVFVVQEEGSNKILLNPVNPTEDLLLAIVEGIFGFSSGQELTPMTGLNEFLSAVIAVRVLEATLEIQHLVAIAVCIEATIPFRADNDQGTCSERLFAKVSKTNETLQLNLSEEFCIESVQRSVRLSNRDVGNFSSQDRVWFLDNTWSLLPETNEKLRHQFLYTVKEFQFAVFKMSGFFGFVKPDVVFCQFKSVPNDEEFDTKIRQCTRNLQVGKKYIEAKLLSSSILMAFAELTGGDAPMSLFMGDLPSRQHASIRLVDSLPQEIPSDESLLDMDVYNILAHGRAQETSFDIKQSPLAAFLYGHLGDKGLAHALDRKVYPMGHDEAMDLLRAVPKDTLQIVADNMAKVAVSRRLKVKNILEKVFSN